MSLFYFKIVRMEEIQLHYMFKILLNENRIIKL